MRPRRPLVVGTSIPPTRSGNHGDSGSPVYASPRRTSTQLRGVLLVLQKVLCYIFLAGIIGLASIAIPHLLSIPWTVYRILTAHEFDITVTLNPDATESSVGGFAVAMGDVTFKYGRFLRSCGYLWYLLTFCLFIGLWLSAVVLIVDFLSLSYVAWKNGEEEWLHPPWSVLQRERRSPAAEFVIEYGGDLAVTWSLLTVPLFMTLSFHRAVQHWANGQLWDFMCIFGWPSKSVGVTLLAIVVNLLLVAFLVTHFIRVYSERNAPRSGEHAV